MILAPWQDVMDCLLGMLSRCLSELLYGVAIGTDHKRNEDVSSAGFALFAACQPQ